LRKSLFDGIEKIKVIIQIGDSTFESNPTEMNFSNDNFLIIHKRELIVSKFPCIVGFCFKICKKLKIPKNLPEEMEYKPHLNIKCIAENSLKKQRLVGSFTVKTISDYFKSTDELKEEYKKCNMK
jgi:hypothetical protein